MATSVLRSPEDLGRALARLRATRDITQEELAEALGISRRYVYEIESGKPNLYARRLFEALNLLGGVLTLDQEPPTALEVARKAARRG